MKKESENSYKNFYREERIAKIIAVIIAVAIGVTLVVLSAFLTMRIANSDMPLWLKLFLTR